jgi:monofunctional biosynthetic peptidoglycan transglycosylase
LPGSSFGFQGDRIRRHGRGGGGGWIGKLFAALLIILVAGPVATVVVYRFLPPPGTSLMLIRVVQGEGWRYHWRSLSRISPSLVRSVVAAEDARFCEHHGFDWNAMQKAMAHNEHSGRIRGGSTISQQTAKNVFLWPSRDYVRKGLEAWFTVLEEGLWGKRRIMEMYLNVVEWGPGVYGAEAASQRWFRTDADRLTPSQAATLAAILPSPLKWQAARPGPYVARRSRKIGARSGAVRVEGLAACIYR